MAATCLLMVALSVPSVTAQDGEDVGQGDMSLAPAEFTVRSLPLQPDTYTIPRDLIVKNNADEAYLFWVSVEIPPEDSVREGYEPIPSEEWIVPSPSSSFVIEANSFAVFQLAVDIPAERQYTGQKWEVWVAVERIEPQSELVSARVVARVKLETAGEVSNRSNTAWWIGLGIGLALLLILLLLLFLLRRRRRKKKGSVAQG
jgi:MYXO-CTERM domain-containing protein